MWCRGIPQSYIAMGDKKLSSKSRSDWVVARAAVAAAAVTAAVPVVTMVETVISLEFLPI